MNTQKFSKIEEIGIIGMVVVLIIFPLVTAVFAGKNQDMIQIVPITQITAVSENQAEPIAEASTEDRLFWIETDKTSASGLERTTKETDAVLSMLIETEISESLETVAIQILSVTSPVERNQKAMVCIKGSPFTVYGIDVFYTSSKSSAKGLEDKTSDADGLVTWEWKIGGRTAAGEHTIAVYETADPDGTKVTVTFITTE